jgi:CubicO group peptidase (beta-lactamase class C family)
MMFSPSVPIPSAYAPRGPLRPRHRAVILPAFGGVLMLAGVLAAPGVFAAPSAARLDSITGQFDRDAAGWLSTTHVPGAAIALVRDGQVAWAGSYGQADPGRRVPIAQGTVFQVGSISKPVTAWGVLRLVDKGRLDLDAPVETYLTRWHLPASDYDADRVTIRRLLNHSAGLSLHGYPGLPPTDRLPSLEESLAGDNGGAGAVYIARQPGSRFSYSGGGYTVLQLVIEEVTGESFATYMQREVLDPLGMTRSSFQWRSDLRAATAIGHNPDGQPYPNYLFTEKAAAGLYTTAADLARFAAAAMTGPQGQPPGRGVLSTASLAAMLTPVALPDEVFGPDATRAPHRITWGLGYEIDGLPDGTLMAWHDGSNSGWDARFVTLPERREGIVILTNANPASAFLQSASDTWANWLGIPFPGAPPPPRPNHSIRNTTVLGTVGLLALTVILGGGYLLRAHRARRRP